jgi:ribose/xylose/arabinose/galactoside ABC-type transport system permease subunit
MSRPDADFDHRPDRCRGHRGFCSYRNLFREVRICQGGNEEAARLAGVNAKRMGVILFAICGFACGITS